MYNTFINFQNWIKADKERAGNLSWNKIFHEFVETPSLPSLMSLYFFDSFAKNHWKNEWGNVADYRKVIINWKNENEAKENESEQEEFKANAMRFYNWLEEDPNRKQNLSRWEEQKKLFLAMKDFTDYTRIIEVTLQWRREEKSLDYWKVWKKWVIEVNNQDPTLINTIRQHFYKNRWI